MRLKKSFSKPSLTRQSFSDECDINNIMARFEKTGIIEHLNQHQGTYGDFTLITDYHSALLQVIDAQNSFNSLPSKLRAQFNNDPGLFLTFVQDPDNIPELEKMGLIPKQHTGEEIAAEGGSAEGAAAEVVQTESEPATA